MADNNDAVSDGLPFSQLAEAVRVALFDEDGVEKPVGENSQLAAEVAACQHETSRHFLGQLHQHCTMLTAAIMDASTCLSRLDREVPFGAVVMVRGLVEASADLYWLSDTRIDSIERTRRTFLTYLQQLETEVRQVTQFSRRFPDGGIAEEAIDEGWECLKQTAERMASAGYDLRSSKKPGGRYSLGEPKPAIGSLVDDLMTEFHGKTGLNLYSGYSAVAHVEGGGLGTLLRQTDTVETPDGTRYRHGFDDVTWRDRVLGPGTGAASGAVEVWIRLAHPTRPLSHRSIPNRPPS